MNGISLKIDDPTYPFHDIITDPQIVKLYKTNDSVYTYFKSHYFKLLDYALGPHNASYGLNSYEILICGDTDILEPILKSEIFVSRAIEIINKEKKEFFLIGRLSSIMETSFLFLPELSINTFGFIFQLLQFTSNTSVLDLFSKILSKEENFSIVQNWLIKIGFIDQIINELKSIDYNYVSNEQNQYFDVVYEKVFGLYFILRESSLSSIFSDLLYHKDVIKILTKTFANHPLYIENARWQTILALTKKKTSKLLLPILSDAIELIRKDVDILHAYIVFVIEIISQMMEFSIKAADIVFEAKIHNEILNIVRKFCNCTELLKSFQKFVEMSLKYPKKIMPKMIHNILQFIMNCLKTKENKILTPFCFIIMELFINAGEKNMRIKKIIEREEGCKEFMKNEYIEYKKIIGANYGFDEELTTVQKTV